MSLPEHLDPASPHYQGPDWHAQERLNHEVPPSFGPTARFDRTDPDPPVGSLEYDLRRGGINWVDSGGTYDPMMQGPAHSFVASESDYYFADSHWQPRSRIARAIETITAVAFAAFVIAVLFFLEPLTAIFYR